MSNSVVLYHGRDDNLYVVNPDCIPHFDDTPPLLRIAAAIMQAGYDGVVVDEKQLLNRRFVHCLATNSATPEGRILAGVSEAHSAGKPLPSTAAVMAAIRREHDRCDGQS
jgi:hypothetical protein